VGEPAKRSMGVLAAVAGIALAWGLVAIFVLVLGSTEPFEAGGETGPRGGLPWLAAGAVAAAAAGPMIGWLLLRRRRWLLIAAVLALLTAGLLLAVSL
jgi:hypothetical protein